MRRSCARTADAGAAHGFTLIELVACLVIAGILAAVAVPEFLDRRAYEERGYIDEVAAALRHAQRVAIASNCDVSVTIDAAGYRAAQRALIGGLCPSAGAWSVPARRGDGTALAGSPPAGVTLTPAVVQIVFDRSGWITNGAPPVMRVGPFALTLETGSGLARVQ